MSVHSPPLEPQVQAIIQRVVAKLAAERGRDASPSCGCKLNSCGCASNSGATELLKTPALMPAVASRAARIVVDAVYLQKIPHGGTVEIPADAIVTPFAADLARERKINIRRVAGGGANTTIAIGADHGGFLLKESLRKWLQSLGHRVLDLGTTSEAACDYPDFAIAVARAVQSGNATFGIMIDGAGIGSSMAANRVPGVLAANCNDSDAARNAREHNYANMLTMGAKKLDEARAREIILTFLSTPEGEARHKRRVDKIRALDQHS